MANIIIKGKTKLGRSRSEQETNLRKEFGATMSDENLDKLKHLEKKLKEDKGAKGSFIPQTEIEDVK